MGFWDDVVDFGEDVLEDGQRLLGEVVDETTDAAGDVLDFVGADGLADDVRDWGDDVADQLGATPDEKELGQTHDPRELVHGDPGAMRDRAGKLEGFAGNFQSAGEGLRGISVGEFTGEAADAYHQAINEEYPKWLTAAEACRSAAGALNALAPVVESAQQQAGEAIRLWDEAQRQHDEWEQKRQAYNDAVDKHNAGEDVTLPPHPGEDPGPGLRDQAVAILNRAREQRNTAAGSAASTLNDAAGDAPPLPPASERLLNNVADLWETGQMFNSHMTVGLVGAVTDFGKLLRTVNPTDPYNIAHPAQYAANTTSVASGLVDMAAHPDKLIKGFIGTGWSTDPGQATGTLLANFIPFGPKGSGVAKTVLSDAMRNAPRAAGREVAEAGLRPHAPDGVGAPHGTGHTPPNATPSTHATTPDGAPAARPHDTAAPTPEQHTPTQNTAPETRAEPVPESRQDPAADTGPAPEPNRATEPTPDTDNAPSAHETRDPAPDEPAAVDHSPGPDHRPEPLADRTPDPDSPSPSPSKVDDSPSSPVHHDGPAETSTRDPDGPGPDRQPAERVTDETPPARTDGETPPRADADTPPARGDTDTPPPRGDADTPRGDPTAGRPGEHSPGHTEPARTPPAEAPTAKPAVADNTPTPPRADPVTTPAPHHTPQAPHSQSPGTPAPHAGRVEPSSTPAAPRDASPSPGRDMPSGRDVTGRAEAPDARAKPGPVAAADDAARPAARIANEPANPAAKSPIEPAGVVDPRPPGHPTAGDRPPPGRSDHPGGTDRGGPDRGGDPPPYQPRQDPIHSSESSGDGWNRIDDDADDPSYGQPFEQHGDSGVYPTSSTQNQKTMDLVDHHDEPYGHDADGNPLTKDQYDERYMQLGPKGENWDRYPPNAGAAHGTRVEYHSGDAFVRDYGTLLDRIGWPGGEYLGVRPDGVSPTFEQRSLPIGSLNKPYYAYELRLADDGHFPLPDGWRIEVAEIASAFGRDGGGIQVLVKNAKGDPVSVQDLIEEFGVLK